MNELTEKEKEAKYGNRCHICDTTWTKTQRIVCTDYWWHCEKCEKKAEDISKIPKEEKSGLSNITNPIDLSGWGYSNKGVF